MRPKTGMLALGGCRPYLVHGTPGIAVQVGNHSKALVWDVIMGRWHRTHSYHVGSWVDTDWERIEGWVEQMPQADIAWLIGI